MLSLQSVGTVTFDGFLAKVDNFFRFVGEDISAELLRSPACSYTGEWEDSPQGIWLELTIRWGGKSGWLCGLSTDLSEPLQREGVIPEWVQ